MMSKLDLFTLYSKCMYLACLQIWIMIYKSDLFNPCWSVCIGLFKNM